MENKVNLYEMKFVLDREFSLLEKEDFDFTLKICGSDTLFDLADAINDFLELIDKKSIFVFNLIKNNTVKSYHSNIEFIQNWSDDYLSADISIEDVLKGKTSEEIFNYNYEDVWLFEIEIKSMKSLEVYQKPVLLETNGYLNRHEFGR